MCQHQPQCPPADASDRGAAHVVASHPGQGWSLLCNGVVVFEDTGALTGGDHLAQQRRLSDPSLTAEYQRSTGPSSCQQSTGRLDLVLPSKKGHTTSPGLDLKPVETVCNADLVMRI